MFDIFISYRRADSRADTGRLYDRLSAHFGDARVFMDIDDIAPGTDFVQALAASLDHCGVMLVVMGRRWLADTSGPSTSRLAADDDFVRIELLRAMERGVRVIPVLVGGASMPSEESLPPELSKLARFQAFELSDSRFHQDVDQLIATLEADGSGAPGKSPRPRRNALAIALVAGAAIALAVALSTWWEAGKSRAAITQQLHAGDEHAAAGDYRLASVAYRTALDTDANSVAAHRKLIAATRERLLRDGIGSTGHISVALGRSDLRIAPIDEPMRRQAASDLHAARTAAPELRSDVDFLLDQARILKAGMVDVKNALPILHRAHELAPLRADIAAELGLLEALLNDDAAGIGHIRAAVTLEPSEPLWQFYLAKSLSERKRCTQRGESDSAADGATLCAEAIRTYHRAYEMAASDTFWSRHIRHHAVREALDIFHRYAGEGDALVTANLAMSLDERIAEIEFLRPLEKNARRSGWYDYPEVWLATLYAATGQPAKARHVLEALFEQRGQRPQQWLDIYERIGQPGE